MGVSARALPKLLGRAHVQPGSLDMTKETCAGVLGDTAGQVSADTGLGHRHVNETSSVSKLRGSDPLTCSTLPTMGLSVHNTFLHAPMPPPTPVRTMSRCRARSLPRMGTDGH